MKTVTSLLIIAAGLLAVKSLSNKKPLNYNKIIIHWDDSITDKQGRNLYLCELIYPDGVCGKVRRDISALRDIVEEDRSRNVTIIPFDETIKRLYMTY